MTARAWPRVAIVRPSLSLIETGSLRDQVMSVAGCSDAVGVMVAAGALGHGWPNARSADGSDKISFFLGCWRGRRISATYNPRFRFAINPALCVLCGGEMTDAR